MEYTRDEVHLPLCKFGMVQWVYPFHVIVTQTTSPFPTLRRPHLTLSPKNSSYTLPATGKCSCILLGLLAPSRRHQMVLTWLPDTKEVPTHAPTHFRLPLLHGVFLKPISPQWKGFPTSSQPSLAPSVKVPESPYWEL